MKKILMTAAAGILILLVLLSALGVYFAPRLQAEVEGLLSERTGRPVQIGSFGWSLWPALQFKGQGLSIGTLEAREFLYVYVDELRVKTGLYGLFESPPAVESLILRKLVMRIPPSRNRDEPELRPVFFRNGTPSSGESTSVVLERLLLETAVIEILSKDPDKPSRVIEIRTLNMRDLALGRSSHFDADLRYPRPEGDVIVSGQFGPFNREDPIRTPISGKYTFQDADLSAFREISGILTSSGDFVGDLGRNHVDGSAQIRDFQLTRVQNTVPLEVIFSVDRESGNVYLRDIETALLHSRLNTNGEIVQSPETTGRLVKLQVTSIEARVEDLLRIALKGDQPPLTGQIDLNTSVEVPPGPGRVLQRMVIDGDFAIEKGEFTNPDFQKKLAQIGRFGSKDRQPETDNRTFSDLSGEFRLENSVVDFSQLRFGVPGLLVSLTGTYALETEELDLRGRVNLERSVSEMTSGRLSEWLRVLDPLLSKGDAGTSVPIRIKGSRSSPSLLVDF